MKFYYLASPYTHKNPKVRHQRFKAISRYAAKLIQAGISVYAPISQSVPIAKYGKLTGAWKFWRKHDLLFLKKSAGLIVYMMDGWRESVGVRAEIRAARRLGLPIEYVEVENEN